MSKKDIIPDTGYGIVLGVIFLLGVLGIYLYYTQGFLHSREASIETFPRQINGWQSRDIALTRRIFESLQTGNVILRQYSDGQGNRVDLYVVYSADNRKVSYPPEICIQGAGATITKRQIFRVTDRIKATRLIIESRDSREMEIFWYKVGQANTNSYIKQQLKMVMDRMLGKNTAIALVRVSTVIRDSPAVAFERVRSFCREIEPVLMQYLP